MKLHNKNTEELIFDAAKDVFIEKGFDGTRMQEISEKAGINKALLHYYYRTKEKLFDAIFERVFGDFIPKIKMMLEDNSSLFYKIEFFVEHYIEFIQKNPHIPSFILHELNRNPQRLVDLIGNRTGLIKANAFGRFTELVNKEVEAGNIEPIDARQLIVNILALSVFPFVARPIIQGVILNGDKKQFNEFLEPRKKEVAKFVINAIKKR